MSEHLYLLTLSLLLGTVLLVFGMKYFSLAVQGWSRLASDGAYRKLAEQNTASLTSINSELAKVSSSLTAVEKMLKEVE